MDEETQPTSARVANANMEKVSAIVIVNDIPSTGTTSARSKKASSSGERVDVVG